MGKAKRRREGRHGLGARRGTLSRRLLRGEKLSRPSGRHNSRSAGRALRQRKPSGRRTRAVQRSCPRGTNQPYGQFTTSIVASAARLRETPLYFEPTKKRKRAPKVDFSKPASGPQRTDPKSAIRERCRRPRDTDSPRGLNDGWRTAPHAANIFLDAESARDPLLPAARDAAASAGYV